jgi:hypothetical protein
MRRELGVDAPWTVTQCAVVRSEVVDRTATIASGGPEGMPMIGDGGGLEREVVEELRLVRASRLDEVAREPIASWPYDPTDAQRYEVLLQDLFDAVEVVEDREPPANA